MRQVRRRSVLTASVLLVALLPLGGQALAAPAPAPAADRTSAAEAARVDSVPTPRIGWYSCYSVDECATVELPLDYDQPEGPTTTVALLRLKARDQAHKIGSLFVNPGGPGGSATQLVQFAPLLFGKDVLDRFDIVGVDPRGVGASDNVRCFPNIGVQEGVLTDLAGPGFPFRPRQEATAVAAAKALGAACSSTGAPLAASMSTAEVARDMDVLRRAVGDAKLSYLGFSYGTYLGQVYANLFPDRVRALVVDGVLDPLAWAGRQGTKDVPSTERLRSGEGAYKALHEILVRCDRAGKARCAFADGDPVAHFDLIAQRLRKAPLVIVDPQFGTLTFGYADLVGATLSYLYSDSGSSLISQMLAELLTLTAPQGASAAALQHGFAQRVHDQRAPAFDFPYANDTEAFSSVLCTDSLNPQDAGAWPAAADRAQRNAPYFGPLWTWQSVQCARDSWTARDEDAYRGPFTARTANPVLVVGDFWDPATNFAGAVQAARLLPNSRLLASDSWGHTAYGTSACVTGRVDRYLLTTTPPPPGTRCVGDVQPFATPTPTAVRPLQQLLASQVVRATAAAEQG